MLLTDIEIRNAKPRDRDYKLYSESGSGVRSLRRDFP